jgi:hypothetical protein
VPSAVTVRHRETVGDWVVRPPEGDTETYPSRPEAVADARRTARRLGCPLTVETHAGGTLTRPP